MMSQQNFLHYMKLKPMAIRFLLLLLFLFLSQVSKEGMVSVAMEDNGKKVGGPDKRLMKNIDCGGACKRRCGAHSRPNRCIRACGTCCARCNCVPPGTSGNRQMCGTCYTGMTTHGNKTKCP